MNTGTKTAALLLLLSLPAMARTVLPMDTSGGFALPSPAISSVPGYPRSSDAAPKQADAAVKKRARIRVTRAILRPTNPVSLPD